MPKYTYKCDACQKDYIEYRDIEDSQFFIKCHVCSGNYVEVTE
jgi:hypothetical protein